MKKRNKYSSKNEGPHPFAFVGGVVAGGVCIFFGLDIHYFHLLPNCPVGINHPLWIIMSVGGLLMIVVSIRNMIKPPSLRRKTDEFDPSGIADPIARQTEWTSMEGGSNFCTHRLIKTGVNRLEFRPTREGQQFFRIFILIGSVPLLALFVGLVTGTVTGVVTPVALAVLGCVFTGVGAYSRYRSLTPIVFDRNLGLYWKGRDPVRRAIPSQPAVRFNDIHALQLVSLYHPSDRGMRGRKGSPSYFSYELIVVLNDAARVSVVHHGGRKELLEDVTTLSQFLDRPLWNGITDE